MTAPRLKIIVENNFDKNGLETEHGLAYWIETDAGNIIFDTGSSSIFCRNAAKLGINLKNAKALVLSHGHYDHTGGIPCLAEHGEIPAVYMHPDALLPKYSLKPDIGCHYIGMSDQARKIIRDSKKIIYTTQPQEVLGGFYITGPIPRTTDYEDTGGSFFCDAECTQPDLLTDDQAGYFDTENGISVILGCAHAGVINTLLYIKKLCPTRPITSVIGGMHLKNASQTRIARTLKALHKLNIPTITPLHCTGTAAKKLTLQ
jgi:7,8-dihydropterin-6-yl-methyl-4-(beta-D-ribofuranosyl)aminobenzene 5'-phosphate synthase